MTGVRKQGSVLTSQEEPLFDKKTQEELLVLFQKWKANIKEFGGDGIDPHILEEDVRNVVNTALLGLDRHDAEDGFITKATLEKANKVLKSIGFMNVLVNMDALIAQIPSGSDRISMEKAKEFFSAKGRVDLSRFMEDSDLNQDAKISATEVILSQFDMNRDGALDLTEARAMIAKTGVQIEADKAAALFSHYDKDGDQSISSKEIQEAIASMPLFKTKDFPSMPDELPAPFLKNKAEPLIKKG